MANIERVYIRRECVCGSSDGVTEHWCVDVNAECRTLASENDRLREQLRGAVEEVEALRHWIDTEGRNCPANGEVVAILAESRRRIPTRGR